MEPQQPCPVEVVERLLLHLPPDLGGLRALAQRGHERAGPTHRLVVVDAGEASGVRHARIPAACGIFE